MDAELLRLVMDAAQPLIRRKIALIRLSWGPLPTDELARLYERLDERALRERLLFGLAARSDVGAVETLARIARDEADPSLRTTARYWLRTSRHQRAPQLLAQLPEP